MIGLRGMAATLVVVALSAGGVACDNGEPSEPGLQRIDSPAEVDEEQLDEGPGIGKSTGG